MSLPPITASAYLMHDGKALLYCQRRREDALQLIKGPKLVDLPYVRVTLDFDGRVSNYTVDGHKAASYLCVAAYILSKYW